jgi:hypothetical protein
MKAVVEKLNEKGGDVEKFKKAMVQAMKEVDLMSA